MIPAEFPEVKCSGCGCMTDPSTCYCGADRNGVHDNHVFVAVGCKCLEREDVLLDSREALRGWPRG